jgi:hypothetical protein
LPETFTSIVIKVIPGLNWSSIGPARRHFAYYASGKLAAAALLVW